MGLVYFVSILDNLGTILGRLAVCSGFAVAFVMVQYVVLSAMANDREDAFGGTADQNAAAASRIRERRDNTTRKALAWTAGSFVVAMLGSAAAPSRRDIIEAYALVEGSKIINAENGVVVAEAVGKRLDAFITAVTKRVAGEATDAPAEKPGTDGGT